MDQLFLFDWLKFYNLYDWIIFLSALVAFSITLPFMIRYYKLTGSKIYIAYLFPLFLYCVHLFMLPIAQGNGEVNFAFFALSSWFLAEASVIYVFSSFKWEKIPTFLLIYFSIFSVLIGSYLIYGLFNSSFFFTFILQFSFINNFFRLSIAVLSIYIFQSIILVSKSARTKFAKFSWICLGMYHALAGLLGVIFFPMVFLGFYPYGELAWIFDLVLFLCSTHFTLTVIFLLSIPEIFLLTNVHLKRADRLYHIIEEKESEVKSSFYPGELSLIDYVKSLEPELVSKLPE